jgi:hypothetical protein
MRRHQKKLSKGERRQVERLLQAGFMVSMPMVRRVR